MYFVNNSVSATLKTYSFCLLKNLFTPILTWVFTKVWNCLCPDHDRYQIILFVVDIGNNKGDNAKVMKSHLKPRYTPHAKVAYKR